MRALLLLLAVPLLAGCLTAPPASATECGDLSIAIDPPTPLEAGGTAEITVSLRNCGSAPLLVSQGGCHSVSVRLARGDESWELSRGAAMESGLACPAVVRPPVRVAPRESLTRELAWNGTLLTDRGEFEAARAGPYEVVAASGSESGARFDARARLTVGGIERASATAAGWTMTWAPSHLEAAPGEAARFTITLAPARAGAQAGTLHAGNWVQFTDGNTSKEFPATGATFELAALAGLAETARFTIRAGEERGEIAGPDVIALGGERHAAWASRAKEPAPAGLTVAAEGSTVKIRYQLGRHDDACNPAQRPDAKLVRVANEIHLFLAYAVTDVCVAGEDPHVGEGEASGLPAGAYVVRVHRAVTACFCIAPPGGWETEEARVTIE